MDGKMALYRVVFQIVQNYTFVGFERGKSPSPESVPGLSSTLTAVLLKNAAVSSKFCKTCF